MPVETERAQDIQRGSPASSTPFALTPRNDHNLRQVFNSIPAGMAHCSRDLRYVGVNQAFADIIGLNVDRIEGQRIPDVLGAGAFEIVLPSIERVLHGETVDYEAEVPFAFRETPRLVHMIRTPERNETNEITGWIATVTDITESRRTANLAAEQKRILELIARGCSTEEGLLAITSVVSRLWPNARAAVVLANPTHTKIESVTASEIPESFAQGILGAPICDLAFSTCSTAILEGRQVSCADIANDSKWSKRWRDLCVAHGVLACHSIPVFNSEKNVIGSFFMGFDRVHELDELERSVGEFGAYIAGIVVDRDRTTHALRESKMRLAADLVEMQRLQSVSSAISQRGDARSLYEKLLDVAIAATRADFASLQMLSFERSSSGELHLLASRGLTPQAVRSWEWVGHSSDSICGIALREGKRVIVPDIERCDQIKATDHYPIFVEAGIRSLQSTPLISRSGKLLGMISTHWRRPHRPANRDLHALDILARQAADLIERQLAEDLQRQAETALHKSEKFAAAGRMAATIAHEINNPLEAITNIWYLLGQEKLSSTGEELLKTLGSELNRVSHITKQTLEFYREGKAGQVDLTEVIDAAVQLFARKASSLGATIRTHYFAQAMLFGFAGELRQVFANLIGNALEAGSTAIDIRVSPSRGWNLHARKGVCVLVADNGSGIPANVARKVFEPFFTTKEEKGTGLGLWVSKGIVQKNEGWIRLRSSRQPGRSGTCICVFLPTV